jgi:protein-glutamine gamma-glutamyltransferase
VGDDVMKALAIKRYLEKQGFYSLAEKTLTGEDPTARFLFGSLRGYCVHFAHAAVFLLRSQGIPARVAVGYGVETSQRGAGSAVLIYADEAHAWPELYLDGVGWVTFDIYPEQSDQPPTRHAEQELEVAMGELARADATGGRGGDPSRRLVIPWATLRAVLLGALGLALVASYLVKAARRPALGSPRRAYRAVLDRLSDLGEARRWGESRERHAARLGALAPSFTPLTRAHLRLALGAAPTGVGAPGRRPPPAEVEQLLALAQATSAELARNPPRLRRAAALVNPVGWWFTR